MAGSGSGNIAISPMNLYWRIESEAQLDFDGLTGADVKGKYLTFYKADGTGFYLWGDDGVVVDPAPVGFTSVAYTVSGDSDDAATLAAAAQVALEAVVGFSASVSAKVVTYKADDVGEVTDPADVDSGVKVTVCRKGKDVDLGLIDGEPSPTTEPDNYEIKAQQTGTTTLGLINRGMATSVEVNLLETTRSKVEEFYKIWGGKFTPAAGTEVTGMGTAAVGKNMLVEAARLEMQPVNDFGAELSYDFNIMLTLPVPSSLTFSGENPRILTVSFQGYPDLSKDSRANIVLIGDPTQTGL